MNIIVIVHTFQAFLLCLMLMTRRFRSLPNRMLMIILAFVVVFNVMNTLVLNDLLADNVRLMLSAVYLIPPPLIYGYWYTYIYGKLPPKRTSFLQILPIMSFLLITFIIGLSGKLVKQGLFLMGEITWVYHMIYPVLMLTLLKSFYGMRKEKVGKALSYNTEKTSILKIFMFMMIFHSLVFFAQYNAALIFPSAPDLHFYMKAQLLFMILLQYLITWIVITMPVVIHFDDRKVGLASFKKYDNSSMKIEEARSIAGKLNAFMEKSKPYQNPLYSVQDLSKDTEIDYIEIAETLNGLLGQSFNDYVNNYRIEEVKRLFRDPQYKKEAILSIAFEAGFNSKAAFYSSFKKFTGETPSQCRHRLEVDS